MRPGLQRTSVRALLAALSFAFLARGAAAAGADLVALAQKYKAAAVEKLKAARGVEGASEIARAAAFLKLARKLLLKHREPLPQKATDELADVNALLYWARGKLPEDPAATVALPPLLNPGGKGREELGLEYLGRARVYAARNPDDRFMTAVRYAEVAGRFEGTEAGRQAHGLAAKHERLAPGGAGERPAAAETPPDPARGQEVVSRLFAEVDSLIGRGDYPAALSRVEKAAADAALDEFTDVIIAAHGVCEALETRRRAIRRAVEAKLNAEIRLETTKGKIKGRVMAVLDRGIDLFVSLVQPGVGAMESRTVVKWDELTPKQTHELAGAGGWKAKDADAQVALAYLALQRRDKAAAERALRNVAGHLLAERLKTRIESLARPAAKAVVKVREKPKPKAVDRIRGLIGHWKFDEGKGSTARDSSGRGHHGKVVGATWAKGKSGAALSFDEEGECVDCGTAPGSAPAITVAFWMKPDRLEHHIPLDKCADDASGTGWTIKLRRTGEVWFCIGSRSNSSEVKIPDGYAIGAWAHVACTFQGGTAKVYLDGTEKGSRTGIRETVNNTATSLYMGRASAAWKIGKFRGLLDDVRIYDRALSAEELRALAAGK